MLKLPVYKEDNAKIDQEILRVSEEVNRRQEERLRENVSKIEGELARNLKSE